MAKYKIEIKRSAAKEIKALPAATAKIIISKIGELSDNPRPRAARKLTGYDLYRLRLGRYRIIYNIEDDRLIVYIIKVAHRSKVYRMT